MVSIFLVVTRRECLQAVSIILICGLAYCLMRFATRLYHATAGGRKWCVVDRITTAAGTSSSATLPKCAASSPCSLQVAKESTSFWLLFLAASYPAGKRSNVPGSERVRGARALHGRPAGRLVWRERTSQSISSAIGATLCFHVWPDMCCFINPMWLLAGLAMDSLEHIVRGRVRGIMLRSSCLLVVMLYTLLSL